MQRPTSIYEEFFFCANRAIWAGVFSIISPIQEVGDFLRISPAGCLATCFCLIDSLTGMPSADALMAGDKGRGGKVNLVWILNIKISFTEIQDEESQDFSSGLKIRYPLLAKNNPAKPEKIEYQDLLIINHWSRWPRPELIFWPM